MIESLAWIFVAVGALLSLLVAAYAFTRRERRDRHTWIDELFGSEEA